jgi:hypothetical protein
MHVVEPALGAYVPMSHGAAAEDPLVLHAVPLGHGMHVVEPALGAYVPTAQGAAAERALALQALPLGQTAHTE